MTAGLLEKIENCWH